MARLIFMFMYDRTDSISYVYLSCFIVVTDRTVLNAQLQETLSGFDHTLGAVKRLVRIRIQRIFEMRSMTVSEFL